MKVLIIYDKGQNVGLGHVTRCRSLMEAFIERDIRIKVDFDTFNLHKKLKFDYTKYGYVVVDSYKADYGFYENISKQSKLVVIDDYNRIIYPEGCTILNPNVSFYNVDYTNLNLIKYKFLGGKKYVLLRKEFWEVPKKKIRFKVKNILIMFGGTEEGNNTTKKVVSAFEGQKCKIRTVTPTVRNVFSAKTMLNNMLWADIAISACGVTLYELMRVGVPTIGVPLFENQDFNFGYVWKNNLILCGEKCYEKDLTAFKIKFKFLNRKKINKNCKKCIDGQGALRVVDYFISDYKNNT